MQVKFDSQLKSYMMQVRLLGHKDFIDVARESLNLAAMNAKKSTIPTFAQKKFTVRRANFFKAMTSVNFAKRSGGNTLNNMFSEVGFVKHRSTENMETQEFGGNINRPIKPTNASRVGGTYSKQVSRKNMFNNRPSQMVIQSAQKNTRNSVAKNASHRFFIATKVAEKEGKDFIFADEWNGIFKKRGKKWIKVFTFKNGFVQPLKARHLMEESTNKSAEIMPTHFVKAAQEKISHRANNIR